jgi:hypothetical protein
MHIEAFDLLQIERSGTPARTGQSSVAIQEHQIIAGIFRNRNSGAESPAELLT